MNCPIHQQPFKLVPAGVSKPKTLPDGTIKPAKPYNAFYACPFKGCREKPKEDSNPPQNAKSSPTGGFTAQLDGLQAVEQANLQGKRMNRSNMAARALTGVIAKQGSIDWMLLEDLEHWVDTGEIPEPKVDNILTEEQEESINVEDISF